MTTFTGDIETTGLLNHKTVDYSTLPYKLKPDYKLHLITLENHETGEAIAFYDGPTFIFDGRKHETKVGNNTYTLDHYQPLKYTHYQLSEFEQFVKDNITTIIGHNFINFDLLALKLVAGFDYYIRHETKGKDSFLGKEIDIQDTLVMSRLLYPDRFKGHSLEELGKQCGGYKMNFRKHIPESERFKDCAADLVYYGLTDTLVNTKVYHMLKEEWGDWNWEEAFRLEQKVADIITIQEHFGFKFNREKALAAYEDLSEKLQTIEDKVLPLLPEKPMSKTTAKEYTPPARQIKKDGKPTSYLEKFIVKHGGELKRVAETGLFCKDYVWHVYDKVLKFPLKEGVALKETEPMLLSHHTPVKQYVMSLGWEPTNWGEKELTTDQNKMKLTAEKYEAAALRYVEDTLGTEFEAARCEHLKCKPKDLKSLLLSHNWKSRPLKVLTSPKYTVDADKTIDPGLERIGEEVEFINDVIYWLTYNHRRNAIWSKAENSKSKKEDTGWLANPRLDVDGRISTPAIPIGANTLRMRHIDVVNIPRVTSIYGAEMRELFEVEDDTYQLGCDFDSLEARLEGHYTYKFDGKDYAESLTRSKPNSVHCNNAREMGVNRNIAKTFKYSATFGAQPNKLAKQNGWSLSKARSVFDKFWAAAKPLERLKSAIERHWEGNDKKWVRSIHGVKLFSRSKHTLLNIAFQSGGAICCKKATVILDKALIDLGYKMNPFEESFSNESVMNLIVVHDELQLQIGKDFVDIRTFDTEEEAEVFKKNWEKELGDEVSEIGHKGDKFYVAYSEIGTLCRKAFRESGEYYNLRVPLSGSYNVGKNWKDCH